MALAPGQPGNMPGTPDRLLSRSYLSGASNQFASLFVAWFQSQRAGASQPHSPKVCLPSNGWTPESTSEITLDTGQGVIPVNRIVAAYGVGRAVVLYWYQTPRRAVADELQAKLWLIADAMRDKRTDTSLVRIVVNVAGKQDDAATAAGMQFARDLYPVLREQLPR